MEQMKIDGTLEDENGEYNAFVEKFKHKKTTDDCYTPQNVYKAVAEWVSKEYGLEEKKFIRPFWPGQNYRKSNYPPDSVVVDNPPFSILSQIVDFYMFHNIRFFLFAPSLTGVSTSCRRDMCLIGCGVSVTYENGAVVNTSFLTNLDKSRARSAPSLFEAVKKANGVNERRLHKLLPKYDYPAHVLTAARLIFLSRHGVDFAVEKSKMRFIRNLDAQRRFKKTIFGGGLLLSNSASAFFKESLNRAEQNRAEENCAALGAGNTTVWSLSEEEKAICAKMDE